MTDCALFAVVAMRMQAAKKAQLEGRSSSPSSLWTVISAVFKVRSAPAISQLQNKKVFAYFHSWPHLIYEHNPTPMCGVLRFGMWVVGKVLF